jgi:ubiquilin
MGGMPGMGGMGGMPGMGGMDPAMMQQMMGGSGAGANPTDTRPPREKYAAELAQIKEMGFIDEEKVLSMLAQCNGNVNLTLERLFTE